VRTAVLTAHLRVLFAGATPTAVAIALQQLRAGEGRPDSPFRCLGERCQGDPPLRGNYPVKRATATTTGAGGGAASSTGGCLGGAVSGVVSGVVSGGFCVVGGGHSTVVGTVGSTVSACGSSSVGHDVVGGVGVAPAIELNPNPHTATATADATSRAFLRMGIAFPSLVSGQRNRLQDKALRVSPAWVVHKRTSAHARRGRCAATSRYGPVICSTSVGTPYE
jgi:hypothetical protein